MVVAMRIKLLFFAAIQDLAGQREAELVLDGDSVGVEELPAHLERQFPEFSGRLASVRIAVNESFANPGERVADGDVVALIPPVSGG
jgi:molybdopterin converting factor subunit 1